MKKNWMSLGRWNFCVGCFAILLAASCDENGKENEKENGANTTRVQTLQGHYMESFERWAFQSCGIDTEIWVDIDSLDKAKGLDLLFQIKREPCTEVDGVTNPCANGQNTRNVFVEIVADVSPLGTYGHLGQYRQQLKILEVLSASSATPNDCSAPSGENSLK